MPQISIIVPVYKVEPYLCRCIDSILAQTFSDFELILVDDGSPDGCGAICDEYAMRDSRICVIHQKNDGQSTSRNRALYVACGEWVFFADSDDLLHRQTLALLYQAVTVHHADMAVCRHIESAELPDGFQIEYADDPLLHKMSEDTIRAFLQEGQYYWTVWGKLLRRSAVGNDPFASGRVYEDNAVICKWICRSDIVAEVRHPLYFYRINPEGTTKGAFSEKYLDFLWALEEQMGFYDEVGYATMLDLIFGSYIVAVNERYRKTAQMRNPKAARKRIRREAWNVWRTYRKKAKESRILRNTVLMFSFPAAFSLFHKIHK